MPRTPRKELAGGIHHVYNRGNRGHAVFVDDADYSFFLNELTRCARKYRWTCLAYCLMPNHFHLVLETPETTLGAGMGPLTSRHAQEFNRRYHPKGGHVFKARFGSRIVDSDEYFAHLLGYLAFNPVRGGLCAKPEEWQWGSHRHVMLGRPGALCSRSRIEALLPGVDGRQGGGYARVFDTHPVLIPPSDGLRAWRPRPPLRDLLGPSPHEREIHTARDAGYRLAEIAAALGVHESTVSRWLRRS